jgi:hypothetical protein
LLIHSALGHVNHIHWLQQSSLCLGLSLSNGSTSRLTLIYTVLTIADCGTRGGSSSATDQGTRNWSVGYSTE